MKLKEVRYRKSFQLGSGYVTFELAAEPEEKETAAVIVDKLRKFIAKEAESESVNYRQQQKTKLDELNNKVNGIGS